MILRESNKIYYKKDVIVVSQDIYNKIEKIILAKFDLYQIAPDSKLQDDIGADSLDLVGFIMDLEDEFDIEIQDEDVIQLGPNITVKDIAKHVALCIQKISTKENK
jgi:acyl carrier protein